MNNNSKTIINIEYAAFAPTSSGKMRKLHAFSYRSANEAQKALEEIKKLHSQHPDLYENCNNAKIMKRTVITTIFEWEDAESGVNDE